MFPKANNPCWPLPADYNVLSSEGQRQARVSVCRDVSGKTAFVAGHLFFRQHYLAPEGQRFYGESGLLPPAPGHIDMLEDFFLYPFCAEAAPRGGGKTKIFGNEMPLRGIVCWPYREVVVCSASEKLIAAKAEMIMIQLEENDRIIDDFGKLAPKRGSGRKYNEKHMRLNNGSLLENLTIGSRNRGTRTSWFILDDPEYDPENQTQERLTELSQKLEHHIFRIILPMLDPAQMKLYWIGTMLGSRSFLHHVCFSKEPKYDNNWMRRIQSADCWDKETGEIVSSTWPERFTVAHLKLMRQTMGKDYDAEYRNNPAEEGARLLEINWANTYTVDKVPENLDDHSAAHLPNPEAAMTYHYFTGYGRDGRKTWQVDRVNQKAYFERLLKIATIDYAPTRRSTSDLKTIIISGFDARNAQWILDCWAGRMADAAFYNQILRFCAPWLVDIISPEDVGTQQFLVDAIKRRLYEGENEGLIPLGWRPAVFPPDYPRGKHEMSKGRRIAVWGEYAMKVGMIKLPQSYSHKLPFKELFNQVTYFTEDLRELKRDDLIDGASMTKWVPHARGTAEPTKGRNPGADLVTMIKQGGSYMPGGEGLVGLPMAEIREEHLALLVKQAYDNEEREKGEFTNVWDETKVVG